MDLVGNIGWQADNMAMTRSPNDSKPSKPVDRSHRLAMELRKNLRRRKAQERGRAASEESKTSPKPLNSKTE
jgi:hypothetical protein